MAGNRDEWHARPTAALAAWRDAPILAGRDLRSGGTWMGLGPQGRVAVVTNVRDGLPPPHAGPSRGALPVAFLSGDLTAEACTAALEPAAAAYAPFHLVLADAGGCWHLGNHPPGRERLAPGVHGISNGRLDAPWPKTRRLASALADWLDADADDPGALWLALYACAFMVAERLWAESIILGVLTLTGFLGMTVLREVFVLIEHPVSYRR